MRRWHLKKSLKRREPWRDCSRTERAEQAWSKGRGVRDGRGGRMKGLLRSLAFL